jgi:hypothetical protein
VFAGLAHLALVVALVMSTSGLGRATVLLAADGCCAPDEGADCADESDGEPERSSDQGCPLPCSDCVCAGYVAPAIVVQMPVTLVSSPGTSPQVDLPSVRPQVRFLPGVFRPPRLAA